MMDEIKKYIIIVITILLWIIFINQLKNIDGNLIKLSVYISIVIFSTIHIWRVYNIKRFGKLNRRRFPVDATNVDVANFFRLSIDEVINYQNQKVIIFERNII